MACRRPTLRVSFDAGAAGIRGLHVVTRSREYGDAFLVNWKCVFGVRVRRLDFLVGAAMQGYSYGELWIVQTKITAAMDLSSGLPQAANCPSFSTRSTVTAVTQIGLIKHSSLIRYCSYTHCSEACYASDSLPTPCPQPARVTHGLGAPLSSWTSLECYALRQEPLTVFHTARPAWGFIVSRPDFDFVIDCSAHLTS
jgi:hypothetical protein